MKLQSEVIYRIINNFRLFILNNHEFIEKNKEDNYKEFVSDFYQGIWELLVEYKLSYYFEEIIDLLPYGDGADRLDGGSRIFSGNRVPKHKIVCLSIKNTPDIFNNYFASNWLDFDRFICLKNNWYYEEPPFDCVLCFDTENKLYIYLFDDLKWDIVEIKNEECMNNGNIVYS
jgi:hypothetical protein